MAPRPGCSTAAQMPKPVASARVAARPVASTRARAIADSIAAATTSTVLTGSRSSRRPATGASALIGSVTARKTAATAQEACAV